MLCTLFGRPAKQTEPEQHHVRDPSPLADSEVGDHAAPGAWTTFARQPLGGIGVVYSRAAQSDWLD